MLKFQLFAVKLGHLLCVTLFQNLPSFALLKAVRVMIPWCDLLSFISIKNLSNCKLGKSPGSLTVNGGCCGSCITSSKNCVTEAQARTSLVCSCVCGFVKNKSQ